MLDVRSIGAASDDALLESLGEVVARTNRGAAVLIAHLAEVDSRRLYLEQACASMFAYCTERLGFDEGAAYKRIAAARVVRRFPSALELVARGQIHLAGLCVLGPHLTPDNHEDLFAAAVGRSKRAIEALVAELSPKPPAPTLVRRLPERGRAATLRSGQETAGGSGPPVRVQTSEREADPSGIERDPAYGPVAPAPAPAPQTPQPLPTSATPRDAASTSISPLGARRYRVQVTASEETVAKLRQAQALLGHQVPDGDVSVVLDLALTALIDQLTRRRFGAPKRRPTENRSQDAPAASAAPEAPTAPPNPEPTVPGDSRPTRRRHIPLHVRHEVRARDGARCTWTDPEGRRCTETRRLELDHVVPHARGGPDTPENLRLICRAHNQHAARRVFGAVHVARRIEARRGRSADRAHDGEPGPRVAAPRQGVEGA